MVVYLTSAFVKGLIKPVNLEKAQQRRAKRIQRIAEAKKDLEDHEKQIRPIIAKRTLQYYEEYEKAELEEHKAKVEALKNGDFYVGAEPKLLLILRIKGINRVPPKPRKVLQLLGLRQIYNACFMRNNKAIKNMLRIVEPWITYGQPSLETVRQLIYNRGKVLLKSSVRLNLTNNHLVEKYLKGYGMISIEDLIHEIYTVGPNFKQANKFLATFRLNPPKYGFKGSIKKHVNVGGEHGDREKYIDKLIQRMI